MELIYAYVHKFRNIEKQEFIFSPSFQINYSSNLLSVHHIQHTICSALFEANHFTSMHLLVGKTGSGKSNLLTLFGMSYKQRIEDAQKENSSYFLLYHLKEDQYYFESSNYFLHTDGTISVTGTSSLYHFVCSLNSANILSSPQYNITYFYRFPRIYTLTMKEIDNTFMHKNESANVSSIEREHCFFDNHCNILKHLEYYLSNFPSSSSDFIVGKELFCKISLNIHAFINMPRLSIPQKLSPKDAFLYTFRNLYAFYIFDIANISSNNTFFKTNQELINFYNNMQKRILHFNDTLNILSLDLYMNIANLLEKLPENLFQSNNIKWKIGCLSSSSLETIHELLTRLNLWIFNSNHNIPSIFQISYDNLSSGELRFVSIFSKIEQLCKNSINTHRPAIILMDEPESFMHPELCRHFILYLTQLCKEQHRKMDCQFIISSHSPFLLSDFPSQCVTLLTINPDTGKCQIIKNDKQTFGSNIHQLLADNFFLDNTIGEFSYQFIHSTISDLLDLYGKTLKGVPLSSNEKANLEYYSCIASYIGDEVIQKKLTELFHFIKKDK